MKTRILISAEVYFKVEQGDGEMIEDSLTLCLTQGTDDPKAIEAYFSEFNRLGDLFKEYGIR